MENSPNIIFKTRNFFAVNNKDNDFKIQYGEDKKGKPIVKQYQNKNEYREALKDYLFGEKGFFTYSRNEEKAHTSLFDYYLGDTKNLNKEQKKKMQRDSMMLDKFGNFVTDSDVPKKIDVWSKQIEYSNICTSVISFNADYIDENIGIKELQKEFTTKVLPKFFRECGYENPEKNLDWVVSLHCDRENNYHFHYSYIELKPAHLINRKTLKYRLKRNYAEQEINFVKRQTGLTIDSKQYTPRLTKFIQELEEFEKYFNPKDKSFTLRNHNSLKLEEKIIRLGYLISKIRETKRIKYNSLPKNDLGKEIRYLTNDIKKELFNTDDMRNQKQDIEKSIEEINKVLLDIDIKNKINNIGFQSAWENKLIKSKLEKTDNYILNAIANHSLYNINYYQNKNEKLVTEDLISEIALQNYQRYKNKNNSFDSKKIKIYILRNSFLPSNRKKYNSIYYAFSRLSNEQNIAIEKFYEMLNEKDYQK